MSHRVRLAPLHDMSPEAFNEFKRQWTLNTKMLCGVFSACGVGIKEDKHKRKYVNMEEFARYISDSLDDGLLCVLMRLATKMIQRESDENSELLNVLIYHIGVLRATFNMFRINSNLPGDTDRKHLSQYVLNAFQHNVRSLMEEMGHFKARPGYATALTKYWDGAGVELADAWNAVVKRLYAVFEPGMGGRKFNGVDLLKEDGLVMTRARFSLFLDSALDQGIVHFCSQMSLFDRRGNGVVDQVKTACNGVYIRISLPLLTLIKEAGTLDDFPALLGKAVGVFRAWDADLTAFETKMAPLVTHADSKAMIMNVMETMPGLFDAGRMRVMPRRPAFGSSFGVLVSNTPIFDESWRNMEKKLSEPTSACGYNVCGSETISRPESVEAVIRFAAERGVFFRLRNLETMMFRRKIENPYGTDEHDAQILAIKNELAPILEDVNRTAAALVAEAGSENMSRLCGMLDKIRDGGLAMARVVAKYESPDDDSWIHLLFYRVCDDVCEYSTDGWSDDDEDDDELPLDGEVQSVTQNPEDKTKLWKAVALLAERIDLTRAALAAPAVR